MQIRPRPNPVFPIIAAIAVISVMVHAGMPEEPASEPIPWSEIGARAGADYDGDGLSIMACGNGAVIHSVFQRLRGEATPEGLWLESTVEGAETDRFRVRAAAVARSGFRVQGSRLIKEKETSATLNFEPLPLSGGRRSTEDGHSCPSKRAGKPVLLSSTGRVEISPALVRYIRPCLVEEYSTSMDGIRQDFLVLERPEGEGELRVELGVDGARAKEAGFGARLVLENSGRHIAYSRLHVEDAEGRVLPARISVAAADRLMILVADAGAVYPVRIDPTFSDENWISMGGVAGADNEVRAMVVDEKGNLYIGGGFGSVGNTFTNHIAKWNGHQWTALGSGVSGWVNALAIKDKELYVGGHFLMAGGVSGRNRIAKWAIGSKDDSGWSGLGSGVDATHSAAVFALMVEGDYLYVGGFFQRAGGVTRSNIAKWAIGATDDSGWSGLGSGLLGFVSAMAAKEGELFVGGGVIMVGDTPVNRIAKWSMGSMDDEGWSALGSGVNGAIDALVVKNDYLYVGGSFTSAGGATAHRIAKWSIGSDGDNGWSALGSGVGSAANNSVRALAVSDDRLYVGGFFTGAGDNLERVNIAAWRIGSEDDSGWTGLGSGVNRIIRSLVAIDHTLYVGGDFDSVGGKLGRNRIAKWNLGGENDDDWSDWGESQGSETGFNGHVLAIVAFDGSLYVGGQFTMVGDTVAKGIAQWNGTSWLGLGSGVEGHVRALAVKDHFLYVGGGFTTVGGVSGRNRIAKWSMGSIGDSGWSGLGSGLNNTVNALAVKNQTLYVGGTFNTAGGVFGRNRIAKWILGSGDNTGWFGLGSGVNGFVTTLVVTEDSLYAGGDFTAAGGVSGRNGVAKWTLGSVDNSGWSGLGTGLGSSIGAGSNHFVYALAVDGNDLYVGGIFTTAGGVSGRQGIAKWSMGSVGDSGWSGLGSGLNGSVFALAVRERKLWVGGSFTEAGGIPGRNRIAKWTLGALNNQGWEGIGSGVNSTVRALGVLDDGIIAGGFFTFAGNKVSGFLAKLDLLPNLPPTDIQLSRNSILGGRAAGTKVGRLTAVDPNKGNTHFFALVKGEGDEDNDYFAIDGNILRTAVVLDHTVRESHSIRVRGTDHGGLHVEKVFIVTVNWDQFQGWAEILPLGKRGEFDDPGGFGIPNLHRYAFGMDAAAPEPSLQPRAALAEAIGGDPPRFHLTLTYTRRTDDPDLIFTPEGSDDLVTWTPLVDSEDSSASGDTTETVTVTDPEPADAKPKGFLRVRVERYE